MTQTKTVIKETTRTFILEESDIIEFLEFKKADLPTIEYTMTLETHKDNLTCSK